MLNAGRVFAGLAVVAAVFASAADAATVTLRRGLAEPTFFPGGYTGAADNTIYFYRTTDTTHASYPEKWMRSSDGANGTTRTANAGTNERVLHRFDLSGMSGQNVIVTSPGTITLYTGTVPAVTSTYGLFQIAAGNAGWTESTKNIAHNPSTAAAPGANTGDPTWFYKHVDASLPVTTLSSADTTSEKWLSGYVTAVGNGNNPEGFGAPNWSAGLWNNIDLVDQDPSTAVLAPTDMATKMDAVATASVAGATVAGTAITFTIPAAMIQSWIDNPSANAGLLGRQTGSSSWDFRSSQSGTTAQRPTLTFDYVVPEPASLCLLSVGGLMLRRRR